MWLKYADKILLSESNGCGPKRRYIYTVSMFHTGIGRTLTSFWEGLQ